MIFQDLNIFSDSVKAMNQHPAPDAAAYGSRLVVAEIDRLPRLQKAQDPAKIMLFARSVEQLIFGNRRQIGMKRKFLELLCDLGGRQNEIGSVLETVVDMVGFGRPAAAFYPGRELNGDPTNWWGPNQAAVCGMLGCAADWGS